MSDPTFAWNRKRRRCIERAFHAMKARSRRRFKKHQSDQLRLLMKVVHWNLKNDTP